MGTVPLLELSGSSPGSPGTALRVFPAFQLCRSAPQQTQLCALQPLIRERSGAGGYTGSSPTVVLGRDGGKVHKLIVAQGWCRLQQHCAVCAVEAHWGTPMCRPCPPQTWGAEPPTMGIVLPTVRGKSTPPGWIRLRHVALGGSEHWCLARAARTLSPTYGFFSPGDSETPLAPFEALTGVVAGALQVGKSEALGTGVPGGVGELRSLPGAVSRGSRQAWWPEGDRRVLSAARGCRWSSARPLGAGPAPGCPTSRTVNVGSMCSALHPFSL